MNGRRYSSWVEPIARRDRAARAELLDVCRSLPDKAWSLPSPLERWTYKELIAHMAGDTGKWFAGILGAAVRGERIDEARLGPRADIDAINAGDLAERGDRSVAALIAEIESDGEAHDALLARLHAEHKDLRLAGYETSLESFLNEKEAGNRGGHDLEHAAQLRTALEAGR